MSRHNQVLGSVSVLSIFHAANSWCRLAGVGKCTYTRIGMERLGLMSPVLAYGLACGALLVEIMWPEFKTSGLGANQLGGRA